MTAERPGAPAAGPRRGGGGRGEDEGRGGGSGEGRPPAAPSPWRGALLPVALLAGLAAFVGAQLRTPAPGLERGGAGAHGSAHGDAHDDAEAEARTHADARARARGAPPHVQHAAAPPADPHRSAADRTRALLRRDAAGTYVHALLGRDSLVVRWPDARPVAVWVQPRTSVRDWYPWHLGAARDAFREWARVVPVAFAFTNDSAAAAVHLLWVDRLPVDDQIGRNRLTFDGDGRVVAAQLTLAMHDGRGRALPPAGVRQVALHEVGHALGLAHSPHPGDVMAARWDGRAPALSPADVATARLLYALPVGGAAAAPR